MIQTLIILGGIGCVIALFTRNEDNPGYISYDGTSFIAGCIIIAGMIILKSLTGW